VGFNQRPGSGVITKPGPFTSAPALHLPRPALHEAGNNRTRKRGAVGLRRTTMSFIRISTTRQLVAVRVVPSLGKRQQPRVDKPRAQAEPGGARKLSCLLERGRAGQSPSASRTSWGPSTHSSSHVIFASLGRRPVFFVCRLTRPCPTLNGKRARPQPFGLTGKPSAGGEPAYLLELSFRVLRAR